MLFIQNFQYLECIVNGLAKLVCEIIFVNKCDLNDRG